MKTLVIGLGNPILGDDGVGWAVAEQVRSVLSNRPPSPPIPLPLPIKDEGGRVHVPKGEGSGNEGQVEVDCVSLGGLSLMERLTGAERVILIDSIFTGRKKVGTISQFRLSDLPDLSAGHSASAHDTSLHNALNVGRSMQIDLPGDGNVIIIAIEAENVYDFSQELSPTVAEAVPQAVRTVLDLLDSQK
jgi:hydrogenase maturation protease